MGEGELRDSGSRLKPQLFAVTIEGALSMKAFNLSVVISAILAASGATAATASPTLDSVKAGSYAVDSYHTEIGFSLSHFGFTNYSGLFSGATGSLHLDPANLGAMKLDVSIPVQSIQTTVAVLTDELKGDKWFNVAKFPQATFTSTNVTVGNNGGVTIAGNFTLHGVTKPVVLHAHLVGAGVNPIDKAYTVGFQASGTIKRSDFGVSLYAPAVGDEVELSIAGAFELHG
jgi:polyisoprenoid-binding protein YceI